MNDSISEIADKFKQSKAIIEECFEDLKQMNLNMTDTNETNEGQDGRIVDIKTSMNFIEEKFNDKN